MNREEARPLYVLAVDDEADIELLIDQRMRPRIRSGKYRFLLASDGVKALETLSEAPAIDMVIADINMLNMDGLSLSVRVSFIIPNIKSVVISACGDIRKTCTAMNRSPFDFFVKNFAFEESEITMKRTRAHIPCWKRALESWEIKAESKWECVQAAGEPFDPLLMSRRGSSVPSGFRGTARKPGKGEARGHLCRYVGGRVGYRHGDGCNNVTLTKCTALTGSS